MTGTVKGCRVHSSPSTINKANKSIYRSLFLNKDVQSCSKLFKVKKILYLNNHFIKMFKVVFIKILIPNH
jgi:hypothetical protein